MIMMMMMMMMMMMISGRSSILEIVFLIQECLKPATDQSYAERTWTWLHLASSCYLYNCLMNSYISGDIPRHAACGTTGSRFARNHFGETKCGFTATQMTIERMTENTIPVLPIPWVPRAILHLFDLLKSEWIIQGFLLERDNYWTPLEEAAPWQLLPPLIPSNYPEIYKVLTD